MIRQIDFPWNPVFRGFYVPGAYAGGDLAASSPGEEPDTDSNGGKGCDEGDDGRNDRQDGFIVNRTQDQADRKGEQYGKEADQAVYIEVAASFLAAAAGVSVALLAAAVAIAITNSFLVAAVGIAIN